MARPTAFQHSLAVKRLSYQSTKRSAETKISSRIERRVSVRVLRCTLVLVSKSLSCNQSPMLKRMRQDPLPGLMIRGRSEKASKEHIEVGSAHLPDILKTHKIEGVLYQCLCQYLEVVVSAMWSLIHSWP